MRVGFVHTQLASSYKNAARQLASSPSKLDFITRNFHPLISLEHSQSNRCGLYTLSVHAKNHFYPSALRAGGVLSSRFGRVGEQPGGRLPNVRNPYLCNRFTDFLHSKFCGIVQACSCALSFAHLPQMGLPMGQKLQTSNFPQIGSRLCGTHI